MEPPQLDADTTKDDQAGEARCAKSLAGPTCTLGSQRVCSAILDTKEFTFKSKRDSQQNGRLLLLSVPRVSTRAKSCCAPCTTTPRPCCWRTTTPAASPSPHAPTSTSRTRCAPRWRWSTCACSTTSSSRATTPLPWPSWGCSEPGHGLAGGSVTMRTP